MDTIFGLSTVVLAIVLAAAVAVAGVVILVLAIRRPVLVRLGVRHIPRRRGRSLLIVIGLALSTTIIATSFATGDAIASTVRGLVASSLGRVDEIVVSYDGGTRRFGWSDLQNFGAGQVPALTGEDFAQGEVERVASLLGDHPGVAGIAGALARQYPVSDITRKTSTAAITVLGLPNDLSPEFGSLVTLEGDAARVGSLETAEVYLNQPAAGLLSAEVGDELDIAEGEASFRAVVRAIVTGGDIGGTQPTLIADLGWLQAVDGAPGLINEILIVNRGGADSLRWSAPIALHLRAQLVDDEAASELHRLLRMPATREGLRQSIDRQPELLRPLIERLVTELDSAVATDEFKALIGDPRLLAGLRPALRRLSSETSQEYRGIFQRLDGLSVVELKQLGVDLANQLASVFTSVFLVLGLFSIATGIMLVFLIFSLLAADRRAELGMARALGTQRGQVIQLLLFEGVLYDLAASILGAAAGIGAALLSLGVIEGYLRTYSFQVTSQIEPRSLVIAFCSGLLLTLLTVVVAAWRIARLDVVAAARDLPAPDREPRSMADMLRMRRPWAVALALASGGPLLLAIGLGLVLVAASDRSGVVLAGIGWSAILVGAALLLRWPIMGVGASSRAAGRTSHGIAGVALIAFWAQPLTDGPLWQAVGLVGSLEYLALGGLIMVIGGVWAAGAALGLLPAAARALGGGSAALPGAAIATLASAYLARHRWRSSLAVLMFSLVIFTVTVASVLLAGTRYAYTDTGVQTAGFDIGVELDPGRVAPDLDARLADAEGVAPESFSAVGGQAAVSVEAIQLDATSGRWESTLLQVVDDGWLSGIGAPLTHLAPGFEADAEAWAAIRDRPGLAIIHGSAVPLATSPDTAVDVFGAAPFRIDGAVREEDAFPATVVWARNPRGGAPLRLTVIGVVDVRSTLGEGIYLTDTTLRAAGWTPPPADRYYFTTSSGVTPRSAALGLSGEFVSDGATVTILDEQLRATQGIRLILNQLLTGFMALGLVSGIVALGVIASRTVVERRQQIGVLRAVGLRRGPMALTFLLESSLVAWLGIAIGTVTGILLARNVIGLLAGDNPEIEFGIPWLQLGLIATAAYGATLLITVIPALRAGRVDPAGALRSE